MTNQIRNEKILIIGFPAWEGDYLKSTVQLASELARHNEVLYVEYPFTWKDVVMGRLGKSKAPWRRILGKEERLRKLKLENGASLHVLTLPPMTPVNFISSEAIYDVMMLKNAKCAYKSIRSAMGEMGMERPVVINAFNPFLGVFLARQFEEKALLYYCYDEISAAKWAGRHGARLEHRLMQEADAVITSSAPLFMAKKVHARRSFLVKNGVDFDLFNRTSSGSATPQSSLVGYLGSLDERIDFDLLEKAIKALPHRNFRFVGRVNSPKADRLRKYSNVEIMGPQDPSTLPDWVASFDVCMIPFLKNELTAGIYPLKINEYFAAGKPVVTTSFGDLSDFEHLADVAGSDEDFIAKIEDHLREGDDGRSEKRIEFASQNSWTARAEKMTKAINEVVAENHRAMMAGEPIWVPNNFNRWGEVSAIFFQNEKEKSFDNGLPSWSTSVAFSL